METRVWSRHGGGNPPTVPMVFVEKGPRERPRDAICGKLEDEGPQGDGQHYKIIASGCVWIYLTDCNGNVQSGTQYQCTPGNTLIVAGCHAFGCDC
jgi:hypothetical protein